MTKRAPPPDLPQRVAPLAPVSEPDRVASLDSFGFKVSNSSPSEMLEAARPRPVLMCMACGWRDGQKSRPRPCKRCALRDDRADVFASVFTEPFCDFLTENPTVFHAVERFEDMLDEAKYEQVCQ